MEQNFGKNFTKYYIGLDMGTDSVGWAVTDTNYKLLRINSKNLWGVRLFESAGTAKERRTYRASRRRLQRRKMRLQLLREIFAPCINQVDPNFFARLADSNLYGGDKRENTWFSLFADKDFTDRDFYRQYKTIYHLRQAMATESDPDPRLVYLALHHIIKNRGHFLVEGGMDAIDDIYAPINAINAYLCEHDCEQLCTDHIDAFRNLLTTLACGKRERGDKYIECFGVKGDKKLCALLQLVAGLSVKAKNLPADIADDDGLSVTFDTDWDAAESKVHDVFKDDYVLIENAKLLYDYAQLKKLLGVHATLSEAMVAKYEKHRRDLALLKKILRRYGSSADYDKMFKSAPAEEKNYTAYCGKVKFGGKKARLFIKSRASYDDFAKYVKKVLEPIYARNPDEDIKTVLDELNNGTFLPKQVGKSNSTIPYQLNERELCAILQNVRQYPRFEFLNQCAGDGIDNAEKIRRILVFRMPYFVGPTNNHSGKYWIVRKQDGKILPWNLESKVDLDNTERQFIQRLTLDCPYVAGEKVLPKCSLLYEEFAFLNIVNKIKINREPISVQQKNMLSQYFAEKGESKLNVKTLKRWLAENNLISCAEDVSFEGFDEGAAANRRTYYQFVKIMGSSEQVEKYREQIEKIIFDVTIGANDKNRLRKRLKTEYDFLSEQQIKAITGLTCVGWGRYSQKFLTMRVGTDPVTGEKEAYSIIDALRKTSENFEQVYNKYDFKQYFENAAQTGQAVGDMVDNLYCSPSVKKQIRQALAIVKELRSVLGCDPAKIFVEVARDPKSDKERDNDEKKRTKSRLVQLRDKLFAESALDVSKEVKEHLSELETDPRKLSKINLYLYFLQNGKDIYTGETIDYNNLQLYDHDHIYPRSKVKDDSIDNLVLTLRHNNLNKSDSFPVSADIQRNMRSTWQALRKQNLMSEEKYYRLTRTTPLSDTEIKEFVNKQLVETRQSTKEAIKIFKAMFPNTEVVYSKAALVSDFRARPCNESVVNPVTGEIANVRRPMFVKCRDINDLHHAKDAYLNIVVGNVYNTRYGHNAQFMASGEDHGPSDAFIYDYDVGTKDNSAWIAGKNGTIVQVAKTMHSNTPLYTVENKVKSGALFDATIYSKGGEDLVPLKGNGSATEKYRRMSDTAKYGGYKSEKRPYFMLVKYVEQKKTAKGVKEKVKYCLLGVRARFANGLDTDDARREYCVNYGLNQPTVLIPQIKIGTFFRFGKTLLSLSGMSGNRTVWRLAQQNVQSDETERYFKNICNVLDDQKKAEKSNIPFKIIDRDGVDAERNVITYDLFVNTLCGDKYCGAASLVSFANKLKDLRDGFCNLTVLEQCKVLVEIAKVLRCDRQLADLSLLNDGKTCGEIKMLNTFDDLSDITIIHRSVTGIFEQQISLAELAQQN